MHMAASDSRSAAISWSLLAVIVVNADPCAFPGSLSGSTQGQLVPPTSITQDSVQRWLEVLDSWRDNCTASLGYNGSIYRVEQLQWTQSSFIQPQIHPCEPALLTVALALTNHSGDRFLWDPISRNFTVSRFLIDLKTRYGGIDSVLVWPTFPQLGLDDRNQFDYIRSMPGTIRIQARVRNQFEYL